MRKNNKRYNVKRENFIIVIKIYFNIMVKVLLDILN